ncbi:MAG: hypothetical protein JXA41_01445 [Deltaproteobacteria bacterium]|nr:hypothetical protein [Deltaproteobacteria bacterium]
MRGKYYLCLFFLFVGLWPAGHAAANGISPVKLSVFNFGAVNLEASGYGTTITNMLMTSLVKEPKMSLLGRRELEFFLSLNDLQQNDVFDNVVAIGTRLGLDVIVVGTVEKQGGVVIVNTKVIHIPQKKIILHNRLKALGNAGLLNEVSTLSDLIVDTINAETGRQKDDKTAKAKLPVEIKKKTGDKSVHLTWNNPPDSNNAGYEIFRGVSPEGPFTKIANINQLEYLDSNLETNTTYYYKIRSYNRKGIPSEYADLITAETAPAPNPPVILKAEGHLGSIHLVWFPNPVPSKDPLKLKGYKVYRAEKEQEPYKEVANILEKNAGFKSESITAEDKFIKMTYQDHNLKDGQIYYYKLTAYNEKNQESDFSIAIKGSTLPAITGLKAQGGMIRKIILSWKSTPSPFIKGYYVYRSTKADENFTRIMTLDAKEDRTIQWVDQEGLDDAQRYYYRITAFEDLNVESSPSDAVQAVTKGKPPAPEGLKAVSGLVKKVDLSWKACTTDDVQGYNLYRSKQEYGEYTFVKRIDGREITQFTDGSTFLGSLFESLDDGTIYFYAVKSFNLVNVESDFSQVVSVKTKPRPAKPSGLKGEKGKVKSVPLVWNANPEKDIVGYHLYRNSSLTGFVGIDTFSQIADVKETSYVDGDLKDGQTYIYKLQAEDKDGLLSDYSDAVTIQTKPKPRPPEGLKGDIRNGKAHLSWMPAQETDIAHYIVYAKTYFQLAKVAVVQKPDFTGVSLPEGKTRTYCVTAVDRDGLESDACREITVTGK